jgi:hypothetical protein
VVNFRFEIVRRAYGRFSWVFVELQDGDRRIRARSDRDYRSRKRVWKAVDALKDAVPEARVVDATGSTGGAHFPLPTTSFRLVRDVVPLLVVESPVDYAPATRRSEIARRRALDVAVEHEPTAIAVAPRTLSGPESTDAGAPPTGSPARRAVAKGAAAEVAAPGTRSSGRPPASAGRRRGRT